MKTYQAALDYLFSFVSYEHQSRWTYTAQTLNLERFRSFLTRLGNPQHSFSVVHVAGSDGKGSVCAMIASVLQGLGYRVGLYTSPHLHSVRERITVNQLWISKADFVRHTKRLKDAQDQLPLNSMGFATFFELLTAMAFWHFQEQAVDFAVIETGLGGRLDATNVFEHPLVTVITHLSLEHTDKLGNTLTAIASEKLGITKPHVPLIVAPQDTEAETGIRQQTRHYQAPRVFVQHEYPLHETTWGRRYRRVLFSRPGDPTPRCIFLPWPGEYQADNARTAVAALDALHRLHNLKRYTLAALNRGLKNTFWPGRFERIARPGQPLIILESAHTAHAAAALRQSLDRCYPKRRRVFLLGFLQDKNIRQMYQSLLRPEDRAVITCAPTERGASLEQIQNAMTPARPDAACKDPVQALSQAQQLASKRDILVVTGSLYLVGKIREVLPAVCL